MQNTQRMLLMLSALLVMPAYGAINLNEVQTQVENISGELIGKYQPLVNQLIQGKFEALRPQIRNLDLRPFIGDIQQYLGVIKANLPAILSKIPMDVIPPQYRNDVKTAKDAVIQNLGKLDMLNNALNNPAVQQYFNVGAYTDQIINGLNVAKNSSEYKTIKPILSDYYANTLKPAFSYITPTRLDAMKGAFNFIQAKIQDPSIPAQLDPDVKNIAITFGVIRRLITIIGGLSYVALEIESAQPSLPKQVRDVLQDVEKYAGKVEEQLDSIAQNLKNALSA